MTLEYLSKKVNHFIKCTLPFYYYIILPYYYCKFFKSFNKFTFKGEKYKYFCHRYNDSWGNERSIEVPIVKKIVNEYHCEEILEIGNVLSHYFKVCHDVVDKYEKAEGVINQDVVDFNPSKKYKLIISISTLEHVGWDEEPRDPKKVFCALKNLKYCLASGGKLIVTMPIGANPYLDNYLRKGKIKFTENYYLKRISKDNKWVEQTTFCDAEYGSPYPLGNAIFVGIYQK